MIEGGIIKFNITEKEDVLRIFKLCKAVLEEPDTIKEKKSTPNKRWTKETPCCRKCQTTDSWHVGKGMCAKCYYEDRIRNGEGKPKEILPAVQQQRMSE